MNLLDRSTVDPASSGPPRPARVLVVDDHAAVREGIRALLATEPSLRVVGEAVSGDEALGIALVLRPDLIVLDHEMPGQRGLDVLPKLRVILPDARIVMFTMSTGITREALTRGADQVIAKDDLPGLVATLRRLAVARGVPRQSGSTARAVTRSRARRWAYVLVPLLAMLYVASFRSLADRFGVATADLAILIVAAAGAAFGLEGGLIAAGAALPVNAALVTFAGLATPGVGSVTRGAIALAIGASFGQLRDVTLQARARARSLADASAALEASDRRLLNLVERAPVLLVAIDSSGVIVDALGGGFGDDPMFSPQRMRGQQVAVYFAADPNVLTRLSRALSGEEFSQRVQAYGHTYDVHFRARRDQTGMLVGTTAALVNVEGVA